MTGTKAQIEAQIRLAEAQEDSNKIQATMADIVQKYNKTTSRHNSMMLFLTIVIVILTIATVFLTIATLWNQTGRYAISSAGTSAALILDTKTSQLWLRRADVTYYLGTNKNPESTITKAEDEQKR